MYSINEQLCKQIDGVSMVGTLSVFLLDCFMNKMKRDVFIPLKPKLHKRFVENISRRRKRNEPGALFHKINSHYPNITLKIEIARKNS